MFPSGNPGKRRSSRLQQVPQDVSEVTPSRQRSRSHHRTLSNATSKGSVRSAISRYERQKRRALVRRSLLAPQIREMSLERRAEILIDVAGDCLLKVIRAGLDSNNEAMAECHTSWLGLNTMRRGYIFGENAPPIVLYEDILNDLSQYSRHELGGLDKTMEINNLATLAYIILRPDEFSTGYTITGKGKERARDVHEAEDIARRNEILLDAWEKFWLILPDDQKDKETPLRLWLDFATQIYIHYRSPTIDPKSHPNPALPAIPPHVEHDLFDQSAVIRFGRWGLDASQDSESSGLGGMDQERVETRWKVAIERRGLEIRHLGLDTAIERHPYDDFRERFLLYLDEIVSGEGILGVSRMRAVSEGVFAESDMSEVDTKSHRHSRRSKIANGQPDDPEGQATPRRVTRSGRRSVRPTPQMRRRRPRKETSDSDLEKSSVHSEADVIEGEPLQWDMFEDIAKQMQLQYEGQLTPKTHSAGLQNEREASLTPQIRAQGLEHLEHTEETDDWALTEGATPRPITQTPAQAAFNFASRQEDAVRLEWDSQTPRPGAKRDQGPLSLPGGSSSRAPSETPSVPLRTPNRQPRHSTPPSVFLFHEHHARSREARKRSESMSSIPSVSLPPSPPPIHMSTQQPTSPENDIPDPQENGVLPPLVLVEASAPRLSSPVAMADEENDQEEEEEVEVVEGGIEVETYDMEDLMPDSQQMDGDLGQSSEGPQTPGDSDPNEMLPTQSQILGSLQISNESQKSSQNLSYRIPDEQILVVTGNDLLHDYEMAPEIDIPEDPIEHRASQIPVRQQHRMPRSRESQNTFDFASPNPSEEEEDRLLLAGAGRNHRMSAPRSIKSSPPPTPPLVEVSLDQLDPYLVDEEGQPLSTNEEYRIPKGHVIPKTNYHGHLEGQISVYSRLSGPRKWSREEELLLYRTLQQVPLDEFSPLRTVWYLHGEHGILSQDLRYFNPQHMKDKMRTCAERRWNNQKVVDGRARAFLKRTNPLRQQYDEEMAERKRIIDEETDARARALAERRRVEDEERKRQETAKEAAAEGAKNKKKKQKTRKKSTVKGKKRRRGTDSDEEEATDDEENIGGSDAEEGRGGVESPECGGDGQRTENERSDADLDEINSNAGSDAVSTSPKKRQRASRPRKAKGIAVSARGKRAKKVNVPKPTGRGPARRTQGATVVTEEPGQPALEVEPISRQSGRPRPSTTTTTKHSEPTTVVTAAGPSRQLVPEIVLPVRYRNKPPPRPATKPSLKTRAARKTAHDPLDDVDEDDEVEKEDEERAPAHESSDFDRAESEMIDNELNDLESEEGDSRPAPTADGDAFNLTPNAPHASEATGGAESDDENNEVMQKVKRNVYEALVSREAIAELEKRKAYIRERVKR